MKFGSFEITTKQKYILTFFIFLSLTAGFSLLLPLAVDWSNYYRPATLALIKGESPYTIPGFINPPWILIPMMPLLLLPVNIGRAILALAMMVTLSFVARKMGANLICIIALLLCPPVIQLFIDGNIDWIVTLGFILPPQIGLFFLAIKPQVGLMVALFWLINSWRTGGIREVIKVFSPFLIILLLSFAIYGFYPLNDTNDLAWGGNASLWPVSIPIGLALFVHSIRKNNINFSIAASPCLSPYVLLHSWIGVFIVLSRYTWEFLATVVGMWIVVIIRGFL